MSKLTQIRTNGIAKVPSQQGDRFKIPDNSVGEDQLKNLGVTQDKLADNANPFPWITEAFQSSVKTTYLTPFNGSPGNGQFRTYGIVNRASIPDLSNDVGLRFGVNRIPIQRVVELNNESGPNGEKVYGALNDTNNQFRFVGTWGNQVGGDGVRVQADIQNDFIEIVFWGTGLNLLVNPIDQAGTSYIANVDGGADSADLTTATGQSTVLQSRNTTANVVLPVTSGLTASLHSVKIRLATVGNGLFCQGFEILNESSTLKLNPGSVLINGEEVTIGSSTPSYNSGFTNVYGTPGTKGGRVLSYIDNNAIFHNDIQYTDTSALTILSGSNPVDHTNEEVTRIFNFREFSAGRFSTADDFGSLVASTADKYFTLDDGITSLAGDDIQADTAAIKEALVIAQSATSAWTLTFVGTGIDIFQAHSAVPSVAFPIVYVDGINVASGAGVTWGTRNWVKIASGLPYGVHTLRISQAVGGTSLRVSDFRIYAPKKPTLPDNCIEIDDYCLMANFDATNMTGTAELDGLNLPNGVLFKSASREMIYTNAGTSATANPLLQPAAFQITSPNTATISYTFFGTGFVLLANPNTGGTYQFNMKVDGVNYPGATIISTSFIDNGSGNYTSNVSGGGTSARPLRLYVSGLTLNEHTITFTVQTATAMNFSGLHIITPTHSPKFDMYGDMQNTLLIGSCSLSDKRKFSALKELVSTFKSWAQAISTSTVTTTATVLVPMPEMQVNIEVKEPGSKIAIMFSALLFNNGALNAQNVRIYVDGVPVGLEKSLQHSTASANANMNDSIIVPVSPGQHTVQVFWRTNGGTLSSQNRNLSVFEL